MFRDSMKMLEKYRLEKEKFLIFHLEIESVPSWLIYQEPSLMRPGLTSKKLSKGLDV